MIPKILHYCWFGDKPLPQLALKCIASWEKMLPGYYIKKWNESNFDVNIIPYTREAYAAGKYAFVSDYARFWILFQHGGIYLDTDVEIIKSMDIIIDKGSFMGIEKLNKYAHDINRESMVAPGLGMGAEAGNNIYKEILEHYENLHWCDENGVQIPGTVVTHATKILQAHGFDRSNTMQCVEGIYIYPSDVFCPMDGASGVLEITSRTVSIHWYSWSWLNRLSVRYILHKTKKVLIRFFGERIVMTAVKCLRRFIKFK